MQVLWLILGATTGPVECWLGELNSASVAGRPKKNSAAGSPESLYDMDPSLLHGLSPQPQRKVWNCVPLPLLLFPLATSGNVLVTHYLQCLQSHPTVSLFCAGSLPPCVSSGPLSRLRELLQDPRGGSLNCICSPGRAASVPGRQRRGT